MSTKITRKFQSTVLLLSASFSSPRQQRRTELYASQQNQSTPNFKKLQNFCNCLYLNNFKFIKFYIFTRCTESSKIIALQLCSYLPHSDAISLYIAGALVLSTLTIYTFFNKTIINLKLSYYEQPTNPTKI